MKEGMLAAGAVASGLFLAAAAVLLMTGPHMDEGAGFKTYDVRPVAPADGAVSMEPPPTAAGAAPATPGAAERGRTDYEYYCVFCHGARGRGDGPVGISYLPKPADLSAVVPAGIDDRELGRRMLTGPGHSPVLERVVPPSEVPYLAAYVRGLASSRTPAPS